MNRRAVLSFCLPIVAIFGLLARGSEGAGDFGRGTAAFRAGASRAHDIALLAADLEGNASTPGRGMMLNTSAAKQDLKNAKPASQVVSITHCGDMYTVKTADDKVNKIWEFNLHFKTDSSDLGPRSGRPVIVSTGMQGDRAAVVFAAPNEISSFITEACSLEGDDAPF